MTYQEFVEIFALLAVQLQFSGADEATTKGYFKALSDLELELVAFAAQRFARGQLNAQGEAWFPKAPEWRAMAGKVEQDRTYQLSEVIRKRRITGADPLCGECQDTTWVFMQAANRYRRCACRELRRLEILGRRPLPALPEAEAVSDPTQESRALEVASKHVKGMR